MSDNGKPIIEVEYMGKAKRFKAEEISAMVLTKMKEVSTDTLTSAPPSLASPAAGHFNDLQLIESILTCLCVLVLAAAG